MLTVVIFILILGLLVLAHEFGHFITARKSGMKVFEFGFGFPPRVLGVYRDQATKKLVWKFWKKKDEEEIPTTVYSLNLLPLGGFVRIKGEDGGLADEADSFGFQKAWKRTVVLASGVLMNVILAGVLLSCGFMVGLPTDLSVDPGKHAIIVEEARVMVQAVDKASPADEAGIKFGDRIFKIDGQEIKNSEGMVGYVQANFEKEMLLTVERGGQQTELKMTPRLVKPGEGTPRLGVMLADAGVVRYPWYIALYKGFVSAGIGLINVFIAFYLLIKNLILGRGLMFDVSGPVGIAVLIGQSARLGVSYLINITAMISLSLAAINILPIPALDGGRILFILIEKIIRRPLPMKYEQLAHTVGFVLLMILIVVVTGRDVWGLIK
ncbi:MAG: RIP metalloprotease RseP [Candidatus Magasanikbacteria bacterium]|nr:RIP metalloprotease RseP [Candidatus Magasanikbacteria bacterium]